MKKTLLIAALLASFFSYNALCADTLKVVNVQRYRILVDSTYDEQRDSVSWAFIEPYQHLVDSIMSPVVGHVQRNLSARRPESPLSNLLADILIWASERYGEKPVLAVYNIGGIRASLPAGAVTYGDVLQVAPFENKICFLTLNGNRLLELFSNIAAVYGEGVSKYVEIVVTRDGKLKSAMLDGEEINPEKDYRIVTLDYLAEGNDGMTAFNYKTDFVSPKDEKNNTRYIINDYLAEMEQLGVPVDAHVEGRIKVEGIEIDDEGNIVSDVTQNRLVILHTNDTHSAVMPLSKNLADTTVAARGGYLRRAAMIKQEREKEPELLLFDSGDFSQGSPYYTLFKGDVEIGLMNLMGYDAATIGNHEFDFGLENMARIFKKANFPIVCANYDFTGTPLEGIVKPYTILYRKGVKIGVFGVAPRLEGLVMAEEYGGVDYSDPVEKANEVASYLKNEEDCDVIICLSHLGWEVAHEVGDKELISGTRNIDLVLGGHTHTYMKEMENVKNLDGVRVPVEQNGKHGIFVGKIILELGQR